MGHSKPSTHHRGIATTHNLAIAAPIVGTIAIILCLFGVPVFGLIWGLLAIGSGIVAIVQINKDTSLKGNGFALTGVIFGATTVLFAIILIGSNYANSSLDTRTNLDENPARLNNYANPTPTTDNPYRAPPVQPSPYCGDGICNNGETCSSCSQDCGACPIVQQKNALGVTHYGGNATVTYSLSNGNQYTTTYPEQTLNYYVVEGNDNRDIIKQYSNGVSIANLERLYGTQRVQRFYINNATQPVLRLTNTQDGVTFNVQDYVAFADTSSVQNFASYIKDQSTSDKDFIRNVLLVKGEVTTYTYNIQGEPRYPLETFLEGGGDCGASSIFVASMLKAAHPEWTLNVWYVNTDTLSSTPDSINHMIVSVNTGQETQFIETTQNDPDQALSYYDGKSIRGWSFEIR